MQAALLRNDRYLLEFVEALSMCPFARKCRTSGRLHRRVLPSSDEASLAVREVEALPDVEVALLICPTARADGPESAHDWEAFAARLRAEVEARHGAQAPFHVVAFHPDLPRDLGDPARAVHFIRRSPDPTLQLVNARVLEAVREGHEGGSRYLDPRAHTLEELLALAGTTSLSDAIAAQNLETIRRHGPEKVEQLLASMRPRR